MVKVTNFQIFAAFSRVGAFTLGGGLAMISVLRHELIAKRAWVTDDEFTQELAMATALPGAMVINFSLFSGYRMRGVPGAAAAFLGAVLPSFIAVMIVAAFFFPHFSHPAATAFLRGAGAAVAGLLAHTAFTICRPIITRASYMAAAAATAFLALIPTVNPIFALLLVSSIMFQISANKKIIAYKKMQKQKMNDRTKYTMDNTNNIDREDTPP